MGRPILHKWGGRAGKVDGLRRQTFQGKRSQRGAMGRPILHKWGGRAGKVDGLGRQTFQGKRSQKGCHGKPILHKWGGRAGKVDGLRRQTFRWTRENTEMAHFFLEVQPGRTSKKNARYREGPKKRGKKRKEKKSVRFTI